MLVQVMHAAVPGQVTRATPATISNFLGAPASGDDTNTPYTYFYRPHRADESLRFRPRLRRR